MASPRGISTSRAYWELKADQVMDRLFAGSPPLPGAIDPLSPADRLTHRHPTGGVDWAPIDVVVREAPPRLAPTGLADRSGGIASPARGAGAPRWIVGGLAAATLLASGFSLLVWHQWSQANEALAQERNLQLLERLRGIGQPPAAATTQASADGLDPAPGAPVDPNLPPPPPLEPWVQELAALESGGSAPGAPPLSVPVRGPLQRPVVAAAPLAAAPLPAIPIGTADFPAGPSRAGGAGGTPELVGVVQAQGKGGSAIFQMGDHSASAAVGEAIGGSGWRLMSTSGDSVVIERNGQQQRVRIGGSP